MSTGYWSEDEMITPMGEGIIEDESMTDSACLGGIVPHPAV